MEPVTKTLNSPLLVHHLLRYLIHILIYFTNSLISERNRINKKEESASLRCSKGWEVKTHKDSVWRGRGQGRAATKQIQVRDQKVTARRKWYVHEARSTKVWVSPKGGLGKYSPDNVQALYGPHLITGIN